MPRRIKASAKLGSSAIAAEYSSYAFLAAGAGGNLQALVEDAAKLVSSRRPSLHPPESVRVAFHLTRKRKRLAAVVGRLVAFGDAGQGAFLAGPPDAGLGADHIGVQPFVIGLDRCGAIGDRLVRFPLLNQCSGTARIRADDK